MFRSIGAVVFSIFVISLGVAAVESADYSCTNCLSEVSAGESHTCAIREDGSLTCWGYDFFGQATPPKINRSYYDFAQVSAGGYHTCAVLDCTPPPGQVCPVGNVICWGNDTDGQALPVFSDYSHVSAGRYHTCGLETDNDVVCWGADESGQSTPPALPVNNQFIAVSAGGYHSCGLVGCAPGYVCFIFTNVRCWGSNGWGQTAVAGLPADFVQLSTGFYHNCGLRETGFVECWGRDDDGQSSAPTGTAFQQVAVGAFHSCGLKTDGTIACWGLNNFGQASPPAGTFEQISAGGFHTCGVRPDGSIVCWGSDTNNQTVPTAGLCGLFRSDLEIGGDCRWSNSSTPYWAADCDADKFAAADAVSYCLPDRPIGAPPECPAGAWIDRVATCGAYDCLDENPFVFAGQTSWFPAPYNPGGQKSDRFDFNCDGVEEKQFENLSTNVCCGTVGGPCLVMTGPGCDSPGWDTATVSEVPACGEIADYRTCAMVNDACIETVTQEIQYCR